MPAVEMPPPAVKVTTPSELITPVSSILKAPARAFMSTAPPLVVVMGVSIRILLLLDPAVRLVVALKLPPTEIGPSTKTIATLVPPVPPSPVIAIEPPETNSV